MEVTVYTFEAGEGASAPESYSTTDATDAQETGRAWSCKVIANVFEYADGEIAWDFTEPPAGDDEDVGPAGGPDDNEEAERER